MEQHYDHQSPQVSYHSQSTVCNVRTGTVYRFGDFHPKNNAIINENMDILNTSTLVWKTGSIFNVLPKRFDHTGTLLPNGNIVCIGGCLDHMSEIATGNPPTSRSCHSAVLTQDGRIFVYRGHIVDRTPVDDDLAILDTSQADYARSLIWSVII
ncbi:hypothetical protein RclHR1_05800011 [Rhizophagus clarus]|uniref:Uncharacterized protein n=1 Tax=Rhizophagus clarus TaxID=94130 RepID=A0A2Z6RQ04_9GLOM|nr:hypothetical protein RclHR1_05800011 [Rhizophagus clarus]